jgi:tetratricopeptide (TPR) repeat protein
MSRNRSQQTSGSERRRTKAYPRNRVAWFVAALALLANFPVLFAGFVFDDHPIVEDDRRVNEFRLATIWRTSYWGTPERVGEYRPVVLSSFALERRLLGPAPWHYHAVNWLLHALVAVSVLWSGRAIGLGESAAALAAGLFAVHPIHLDAIAPVVGRAELLAALALSGGTALWIRLRRSEAPRPETLSALAVCLGIAAFSKETALAAVPLLVSVEWLAIGREANRRTLWAGCAAVAVVVFAYLLARSSVLGGLIPAQGSSFTAIANPMVAEPLAVRLLTAASILTTYLRLFAWPTGLSPDYSFDSLPLALSPAEPAVWTGAIALLGLLALAAFTLRRRPAIAVAVVAFLAPYSIVANAAFPIGTMLAERLFYLPSIGLCWLLGAALAAAARGLGGRVPDAALRALVALVAVALTAANLERADDWRDEEALYHEALRTHPRNAALWLTLGELAIRDQRYELAIERMARVNAIVPDFPKAWVDRGTLLAASGQWTPARDALLRAVELEPGNALALRNLAIVQRELGDLEASRVSDARADAIENRRRAPR